MSAAIGCSNQKFISDRISKCIADLLKRRAERNETRFFSHDQLMKRSSFTNGKQT